MAAEGGGAVLNDLLVAAQLTTRKSANQLFRSWLFIPIGILAILATTFGVNKLLQLGAVSFPASVACLVILFLGLLLLEKIIGENRTRRLVVIIEIPGRWLLQWINVFFTPSFILLPLSPSIGGIEVLKIIAVFVIGFLVMMALAAYMTRVLQLMLGSSKRAIAERAEELGSENDVILMTATPRSANSPSVRTSSEVAESTEAASEIQPPPRSRDSQRTHQDSRDASPGPDGYQAGLPAQAQVPPSRATRWAVAISGRLDMVIYVLLFTFVGIPIYYSVGYAMPLQLTFSVLTYFATMSIPPKWRQYLHPVLVSSLLTVLSLWVLGLIKSQSLNITLKEYRTGATYLKLWDGTHQLPGAGDIFASILDASIVSLALPMYQYRRELRQHFFAIVLPNVVISVGSLFAYPYICFVIGISAERSLAFAARSLTLALALPAVANLGGEPNTVAALAITSGIIGVLIGQRMLALLKIPDGTPPIRLSAIAFDAEDTSTDTCGFTDDYVTRGVTLGANSSAIATALLLRTDPRAAALSSLSMSLFGAITVLFTSLPPIVAVIRSLVAL
ncbi:LrgB-like family-domain-containing protein [Xylaria longipes]|nr:LrgB-like family-domain-containing protein [Xylaria longipes]